VASHVPFDLLLGRPWQRGNYVSIEERPEGTYVIFKDPKDPMSYHELLGVPETQPHNSYHTDNWILPEEALPMNSDIFHDNTVYPMTTFMITETNEEEHLSPLPLQVKGFDDPFAVPEVVTLAELSPRLAQGKSVVTKLYGDKWNDCSNTEVWKARVHNLHHPYRKQNPPVSKSPHSQNNPANHDSELSAPKISTVGHDPGLNTLGLWIPDDTECQSRSCYGSHLGKRPQSTHVHLVLFSDAQSTEEAMEYKVCSKCNGACVKNSQGGKLLAKWKLFNN
jgi:hypothetical protein